MQSSFRLAGFCFTWLQAFYAVAVPAHHPMLARKLTTLHSDAPAPHAVIQAAGHTILGQRSSARSHVLPTAPAGEDDSSQASAYMAWDGTVSSVPSMVKAATGDAKSAVVIGAADLLEAEAPMLVEREWHTYDHRHGTTGSTGPVVSTAPAGGGGGGGGGGGAAGGNGVVSVAPAGGAGGDGHIDPAVINSGEPLEAKDCQYGKWGKWSECSESCGKDGSQKRKRKIVQQAADGGDECSGPHEETRECGREECATTTTIPPEEAAKKKKRNIILIVAGIVVFGCIVSAGAVVHEKTKKPELDEFGEPIETHGNDDYHAVEDYDNW